MSNRDVFKKMYNTKVNKKENYQKILNNIDKDFSKEKHFKWKLIPICLVICLCTVIGFSTLNKKSNNFNKKKNNYDIHINEIENPNQKILNEICLLGDDFIKLSFEELETYYGTKVIPTNIPKNLILSHKYDEWYGYYKADNYDRGIYYDQNIIFYEDKQNNKSLSIVLAKERKIHYDIDFRMDNPNKEYVTSKINDKDLTIFHYIYDDYYYEDNKVYYNEKELEKKNYNCYYTFFEKDGVEFDITSCNIGLDDFVNVLASIPD